MHLTLDYIRKVTEAVHRAEKDFVESHSDYVGWFSGKAMLFRNDEGDFFSAALEGDTLVIDEDPFPKA